MDFSPRSRSDELPKTGEAVPQICESDKNLRRFLGDDGILREGPGHCQTQRSRGCLIDAAERLSANHVQQILQFGRQRSGEFQLCARAGMTKAELLRMKKLTMQFRNAAADFCVRHSLVTAAAIDLVADHRMFQPGEVHANLMRASRL